MTISDCWQANSTQNKDYESSEERLLNRAKRKTIMLECTEITLILYTVAGENIESTQVIHEITLIVYSTGDLHFYFYLKTLKKT